MSERSRVVIRLKASYSRVQGAGENAAVEVTSCSLKTSGAIPRRLMPQAYISYVCILPRNLLLHLIDTYYINDKFDHHCANTWFIRVPTHFFFITPGFLLLLFSLIVCSSEHASS